MKTRILIVDDEEIIRKALLKYLTSLGHEVSTAENGHVALELAKESQFDAALIDMMMPKMSGLSVVKKLKKLQPSIVPLVMTAYGTVPSAVEAVKAGAYHYLTKPFELEDIALLINKGIEHKKLQLENKELKKQVRSKQPIKNIISVSTQIQEVLRMVSKVANSDATVLILGESGTGKELVANAIHYGSSRSEQALVAVNCGAIPEELLESELFGHVKGAFTGAVQNNDGRFEVADTGTIFLDEIGDMSPKLQVKILRVLQEKQFTPVGSTQVRQVNVRVIAATHRNLLDLVKEGKFREDLYYRLNVIPIHIPPLRERREDVPVLIKHFMERINKDNKTSVEGFSEEAMSFLSRYAWPGNVRELENLVERMVIMKSSGIVGVEDIPKQMKEVETSGVHGVVSIPDEGIFFKDLVSNFENALILKALEKTGWNKNKAAMLLNLNRTTLVEKIKKKGLEDHESRVRINC